MQRLASLCYLREGSFPNHAGPDLILKNDLVRGLTLALPRNIINYTIQRRDLYDAIAKFANIRPSSIMSITQELFLQNCIAKKLRQDKNCLRKSIAHKNLNPIQKPTLFKSQPCPKAKPI